MVRSNLSQECGSHARREEVRPGPGGVAVRSQQHGGAITSASTSRCGPGQGRHRGSSRFAFIICKVTFLEGIALPQRNSEKIW